MLSPYFIEHFLVERRTLHSPSADGNLRNHWKSKTIPFSSAGVEHACRVLHTLFRAFCIPFLFNPHTIGVFTLSST